MRNADSAGPTAVGPVDDPDAATPARRAALVGTDLALIAAAWALLTGLLVLCGVGIEGSAGVAAFDRTITEFVVGHRTTALDQVMQVVTVTGSWVAALALAAAVLVLAVGRRLPAVAVVVLLLAWGGEALAVPLTKRLVQRPRPPEDLHLIVDHGWSFPSGHAANAVVVFAALGLLVAGLTASRVIRTVSWAVCLLMTALVPFSRVYLGVHWATDVTASVLWTTAWLSAIVLVLRVRRGPDLRSLRPRHRHARADAVTPGAHASTGPVG